MDRDVYYILFVHWSLKTIPNKVNAFAPWDWKPHWPLRNKAYEIRSRERKYPSPESNGKTWADFTDSAFRCPPNKLMQIVPVMS